MSWAEKHDNKSPLIRQPRSARWIDSHLFSATSRTSPLLDLEIERANVFVFEQEDELTCLCLWLARSSFLYKQVTVQRKQVCIQVRCASHLPFFHDDSFT